MPAWPGADDGPVTLRMLSDPPRRPATRGLVRRSLLLGGTLIASCLSMAALAIPAHAVVEEVETTKVGLQPREITHYLDGFTSWTGNGKDEPKANLPVYSFNNPSGNPVMHSVSTYVIYWDPQRDYYHGDWQGLIDGFMANLAGASGQLTNTFAVDAQYTDATDRPAAAASTFLGAYTDTTPYPAAACTDPHPFLLGAPVLEERFPVCLSDGQIKTQLESFINEHGLRRGMGTIFYVLTPPGVAVCLDAGGATGHCSEFEGSIEEVEKGEKEGFEPPNYKSYKNSFCSYHSAVGVGGEATILYAVIPWTAGGEGDNHLAGADTAPGYDCQDGGFKPGTEPNGELEEKEGSKEKTLKEKEEFEKKTKQEQREQEEAEALGLTGPHQQEPNQLVSTRSPDGSYDTGLADLIINQIATEQQNTVTDPLLDAWRDSEGGEVTDVCRNFFAPTPTGSESAVPTTRAGTLANQALGEKSYYLNDAFNLASLMLAYPAIPCINDVSLQPQFTAPVHANAGELVGFDGMESNITLDAAERFSPRGGEEPNYATYSWNFGDGSPVVTGFAPGAPSTNAPATLCEEPWLTPCAASAFHSYQYGGTYQVTLVVTDTAGNTATVTEPVTVVGPPPPASGGPGSGSGATPGTTTPGTTGSPGGPGGASATLPRPVAAAAAVASSLRQVTRKGLLVRYSVNEQVAGRFEVLLDAASAHHLGISGPIATGLPAGTAQSLVIGHALLVTTKGGHSSVRIKFSKSTAKHLRRAHKVTLMLRLVVRNADSRSPLFTTVLSTFVLHG
jgi:hypothetical protein